MGRENVPHVGRPFNGSVRASQMNDVFLQIAHLKSISVTRPLTLTQTAAGGLRFGIQLPKPVKAVAAAPAVAVKQFRILGTPLDSDAIRCFPDNGVDPIDPDNIVWVAKPWFLRGPKTWNNKSRNGIRYTDYGSGNQVRTATNVANPANTGEQTLVPFYSTSDLILAIRSQTEVIEPGTEDDEDGPTPVVWRDLNTDGRMWAE